MLFTLLLGCFADPRPPAPPPHPGRPPAERSAPHEGPPAHEGPPGATSRPEGPPGEAASTSTAGPPASTTPPTPAEGGARPGRLRASAPVTAVVSIHVEGFRGDDRDPRVFERHSEAIRAIAREAHDAGIPLSLELSPEFATGAKQWAPGFPEEMRQLGHGLSLHADVGGSPISDEEYVRKLRESVDAVKALGVNPRYASGICSTGGWVEGMVKTGLEAAVGLVGWCLKSVTPTSLPAGTNVARIQQCRTPVDCHDAAVDDPAKALFPWRASSASSWTAADPKGKLLIIASAESLGSTQEAAQGRGRQWVFGPTEARALKARVAAALDLASTEKPGVLAWTVSVGTRPERGFFAEVAKAASAYEGRLKWSTIDSVIDMEE